MVERLEWCYLQLLIHPTLTAAQFLVDRALEAANSTTEHSTSFLLTSFSLSSAHVPAFAVAVAVLLAPTLLARFPSLDT